MISVTFPWYSLHHKLRLTIQYKNGRNLVAHDHRLVYIHVEHKMSAELPQRFAATLKVLCPNRFTCEPNVVAFRWNWILALIRDDRILTR